ncbi:rod shape-determining protein MreC [Sebaldella sp. S0638]|uniref:rod shape-determining protein MreC n=1 Tax=Sebaldella sp. S0638 TaxID=2957809 RepID=UPI0020A0A2AC|nr:rod shape-determining protein MreC [Sebaldella sp. S0638]
MKNFRIKKSVLFIILLVIFLIFKGQNILRLGDSAREFVNFKLVKVKSKVYVYSEYIKSSFNDMLYVKRFINKSKEDNLDLQILRLKLIELEQEKAENIRLRELLELTPKEGVKYIISEVILLESVNANEKIYINKGTDQGLDVDMPVLSQGVLIGRIVKADDNYSEVMLLTSKKSKVSVLIDGQETGILRGTGTDKLIVENYNGDVDGAERKQLKITTSGISDIFPKDIYIGTYNVVNPMALKKTKEISTKPSFNVYNLREVIVYKVDQNRLLHEEIKEQEKEEAKAQTLQNNN